MKNFLFLVILLFDIICRPREKPLNIEKEKFAIVNSEISKKVDSILAKQDCCFFEISEDGQSYEFGIMDTTNFANTIYLTPNVRIERFMGHLDIADSRDRNMLGYAYQKDNDTTTNIVFYQDDLSHKIFIKLHDNLSFDCEVPVKYKYSKSGYITEKSRLIVDKNNYKVGDTISGYLMYQGREETKRIAMIKELIHFQCVIGTSSNPKEYMSTYERCSGIITERIYDKSRNIIIPSIQKANKK